MDDLISRQAAIDVIDAILPVEPLKNEYTQGITCGAALAIEYVKQLPSAQSEIIYCRNCKKHNVNAGYKKDCCPLFDYRGVSYGHEHDYQYCAYGVKKDERPD